MSVQLDHVVDLNNQEVIGWLAEEVNHSKKKLMIVHYEKRGWK